MALGEDNFLAWLYFNHLCNGKGSNPENNLVIVIRTQRASLRMGLKTHCIDLYTCRKIRFVSTRYRYSHVFVGRASSEAKEPWVCLWTQGIFVVCVHRQPSGEMALWFKKPGSSKDFNVRWIWVGILTFPISNWVILEEVFQLSEPQFLIFKMGMIMPDPWSFCEDQLGNGIGRHQTYTEPENQRWLVGIRGPFSISVFLLRPDVLGRSDITCYPHSLPLLPRTRGAVWLTVAFKHRQALSFSLGLCGFKFSAFS